MSKFRTIETPKGTRLGRTFYNRMYESLRKQFSVDIFKHIQKGNLIEYLEKKRVDIYDELQKRQILKPTEYNVNIMTRLNRQRFSITKLIGQKPDSKSLGRTKEFQEGFSSFLSDKGFNLIEQTKGKTKYFRTKPKRYSKEEIQFLKMNIPEKLSIMEVKKITDRFNDIFDSLRTERAIKNKLRRMKKNA